jgi:hypothetical protein
LDHSAIVRNGATFLGDGELIVASGAVLNIENTATVAVDTRNQGRIAPGLSLGSVTVSDYTQAASATLEIEIGGTTPATQFDQLRVAGSATLDGELNVSLVSGFTPAVGNQFEIVTATGSVSGSFSIAALPTLGAANWQIHYEPMSVLLRVALPGDYNFNGKVDAADYVVWRDALGQSGAGLAADGNRNNMVDPGDYGVWRAHFGQNAGSASTLDRQFLSAVPEPACSAPTAIVGSMLMLLSRRNVRRRRANTAAPDSPETFNLLLGGKPRPGAPPRRCDGRRPVCRTCAPGAF